MFERYDEPARRTLFYARYAASKMGSLSIEGEHLLLGLIREPGGRAAKILNSLPLVEIRKELESRGTGKEVPTSVEIPFSAAAKRALTNAAEEADRLTHRHIGPEHLLLGLMREEDAFPAVILATHGLRLAGARARVAELSNEAPSSGSNEDARAQIDQIVKLATELQKALSDTPEAALRVQLLLMDLQALKSQLGDRP